MTKRPANPYANDGKCHNAQLGSYGHECGKPATWLGIDVRKNFGMGFCDHCKHHGDERHGLEWHGYTALLPLHPTI